MPKLTAKTVTTLPGPADGAADAVHWDDDLPGFGLRVLASGGRSWQVRYRVGRRQRRITLGKLSELSAAEARAKAKTILANATVGHDERAEIERRKAEASATPEQTFETVAALYLRRHVEPNLRPRTVVEIRRALLVIAKPLHPLALDDVKRRNVAELIQRIADERGAVAANRWRVYVSGFWTWAMKQGLAEANPVIGTAGPAVERPRDRVLTDAELRAIWRAADPVTDYGCIVRLLILTGQRREEAAGMAWSELDLDAGLWRIPSARTKNGRPHDVPLSDAALALLQGRERRAGRDFVFGDRGGAFSNWSAAKKRLDDVLATVARDTADPKRAGTPLTAKDRDRHALPGWRVHDLRRTAVTGMAELGIQPHVVEAVVNHVSGHKAGVAGVYNRAIYGAEKRDALARWAVHVEALAADEAPKVVPLRRGA